MGPGPESTRLIVAGGVNAAALPVEAGVGLGAFGGVEALAIGAVAADGAADAILGFLEAGGFAAREVALVDAVSDASLLAGLTFDETGSIGSGGGGESQDGGGDGGEQKVFHEKVLLP